MIIIANTSKLFYAHAWETYLIGGLIIFFLGFFLGWFLWRHYRAHADQVEDLNQTLRERQSALTDKNSKLTKLIKELPKEPAS